MRRCPSCGTEYFKDERFCPQDGAKLADAPSAPAEEATRLATDYELLRSLGRDEMGEVFAARERQNGRQVALKRFDDWATESEPALDRYRATLARLKEAPFDGVPRVLDYRLAPIESFVASQLIEDAQTLEDFIGDRETLPLPEATEIVLGVLDALRALHAADIVHGGLTPRKILLTRGAIRSGIVITDPGQFELWRVDNPIQTAKKQPERYLGSASYYSPEAALGKAVTSSADLYTVGLVFYEAVAGKPPFTANSFATTLKRQIYERPLPPRLFRPGLKVPPALESLIECALAKNADGRFANALAFINAVENLRTMLGFEAARPAAVPVPEAVAVEPRAPAIEEAAAQVVETEPESDTRPGGQPTAGARVETAERLAPRIDADERKKAKKGKGKRGRGSERATRDQPAVEPPRDTGLTELLPVALAQTRGSDATTPDTPALAIDATRQVPKAAHATREVSSAHPPTQHMPEVAPPTQAMPPTGSTTRPLPEAAAPTRVMAAAPPGAERAGTPAAAQPAVAEKSGASKLPPRPDLPGVGGFDRSGFSRAASSGKAWKALNLDLLRPPEEEGEAAARAAVAATASGPHPTPEEVARQDALEQAFAGLEDHLMEAVDEELVMSEEIAAGEPPRPEPREQLLAGVDPIEDVHRSEDATDGDEDESELAEWFEAAPDKIRETRDLDVPLVDTRRPAVRLGMIAGVVGLVVLGAIWIGSGNGSADEAASDSRPVAQPRQNNRHVGPRPTWAELMQGVPMSAVAATPATTRRSQPAIAPGTAVTGSDAARVAAAGPDVQASQPAAPGHAAGNGMPVEQAATPTETLAQDGEAAATVVAAEEPPAQEPPAEEPPAEEPPAEEPPAEEPPAEEPPAEEPPPQEPPSQEPPAPEPPAPAPEPEPQEPAAEAELAVREAEVVQEAEDPGPVADEPFGTEPEQSAEVEPEVRTLARQTPAVEPVAAEEAAEPAVETEEEEAPRDVELAETLTRQGQRALADTDFSAAEEFFLRAIDADDRNAHAYAGLGDVYFQRRDFASARRYHRRAISFNGRNAQFHSRLGMDYFRLERYQDAIDSWERALELDSSDGNAESYINIARQRLEEAAP